MFTCPNLRVNDHLLLSDSIAPNTDMADAICLVRQHEHLLELHFLESFISCTVRVVSATLFVLFDHVYLNSRIASILCGLLSATSTLHKLLWLVHLLIEMTGCCAILGRAWLTATTGRAVVSL